MLIPANVAKPNQRVSKLSDVMSMTPGLPHDLFPYKVMLFVFSGMKERGGGCGESLESHFHRKEILSTQTRSANLSTHPPTHSLNVYNTRSPTTRSRATKSICQTAHYTRCTFSLCGVSAEKSKPEVLGVCRHPSCFIGVCN